MISTMTPRPCGACSVIAIRHHVSGASPLVAPRRQTLRRQLQPILAQVTQVDTRNQEQQHPQQQQHQRNHPQLISASRRAILGLTAFTALCSCCPPAVQAYSYGHQDGPGQVRQ